MTAEPIRVAFGSFDAESAWRPAELATLPSVRLPNATAGMQELLAVLCGPRDVLLATSAPSPAVLDHLAEAGLSCRRYEIADAAARPDAEQAIGADGRLAGRFAGCAALPYSVQPATRAVLEHLGLPDELPSAPAVAAVNSKVFSNELVTGLGLPGGAVVVRGVPELVAAVARLEPATAVIKDPFGVSGRGALRVTSGRVLQTVTRHLDRQVAAGRRVELLVQPYWPVAGEFSAHFDVTADGAPAGEPRLQQGRSRGLAYAGSAPAPDRLADRLLGAGHRGVVEAVAGAVASAGYTGPVCVDGLELADGSLVPLLEVNARLSMGRLNLSLDERARSQGLRSWLCLAPVQHPGPGLDERLLARLAAAGTLRRDGGPGVLILASGSLCPPAARLFFAVFATSAEQAAALEYSVTAALAELDETAA